MANPQRGQCAKQAVPGATVAVCQGLSAFLGRRLLISDVPKHVTRFRDTCITYSLCRHASYSSNSAFVDGIRKVPHKLDTTYQTQLLVTEAYAGPCVAPGPMIVIPTWSPHVSHAGQFGFKTLNLRPHAIHVLYSLDFALVPFEFKALLKVSSGCMRFF